MFFPEDTWREIKSFIFHDIKSHGRHLKNDLEVKNFNKVTKSIPGKYQPNIGPIIVYGLPNKNFRTVKFIYYVPAPRAIETNSNKYKLVIEHMHLEHLKRSDTHYCSCHNDNITVPNCLKREAKKQYNKNVIKKVWFL